MGGGVITPPYNGWYETYEFELDDQLIKADNLNTNLSSVPLLFRLRENALHPNGIEGVKYAVPPLIRHFLTKMPSRCQATPLAVSGEPVLPYWKFQGGHSGRYLGVFSYPLSPAGDSLKESGRLLLPITVFTGLS